MVDRGGKSLDGFAPIVVNRSTERNEEMPQHIRSSGKQEEGKGGRSSLFKDAQRQRRAVATEKVDGPMAVCGSLARSEEEVGRVKEDRSEYLLFRVSVVGARLSSPGFVTWVHTEGGPWWARAGVSPCHEKMEAGAAKRLLSSPGFFTWVHTEGGPWWARAGVFPCHEKMEAGAATGLLSSPGFVTWVHTEGGPWWARAGVVPCHEKIEKKGQRRVFCLLLGL